ncbi:MAG: prolipoprotein diacylglyceryl transferase [Chitinispirillaceae bacterium]|nr:prolipoprotein diacylglyceryl transferase [Chitinispirillaceae bacterium]
MHPVLFKIFSFPIHSYGFMLALSFLFGIWLSTTRAKKKGLNPEVIADVGFWVILSAIVGARLYYVILHFEEFKGNLTAIFNPFQNGFVGIGGLVMYGGFIGAIVAGVLYFRLKKVPFLPYADAIAPSVGFGIFLTRIGCFLNGCCMGAPTNSPLAVNFPMESPAGAFQHHAHAAGLYPSQLFESAGGLVIGLIILFVGSRAKVFTGLQFYLVGILYTILRFMVDFSRHYQVNEKLGPLSHNQVVCIVLFIIFAGLILKEVLFKEEPSAVPVTPPGERPASESASDATADS